MTNAEIIQQGLALLGEDLGQPLSLDEGGVCALEFNEGLACTIELGDADGSLFIHGQLLTAPAEGREALFRRALTLNLYGLQTGGAVAYDPDADALLLCHRFPAELLGPDRIWLNPDCGFGTFAERPVATPEVAMAKLRILAEAAASLR